MLICKELTNLALKIKKSINILDSVAVSKDLSDFRFVALRSFSFTTIKNFDLIQHIAESSIFMPKITTHLLKTKFISIRITPTERAEKIG